MVLVIAYGNPLRRDDGVAWRVAERVAARARPGVRIETAFGLVPEMAAWLAAAKTVIFVDAAVDRPGVNVRCVEAAPGRAALTHTSGAEGLLGLARSAFGARVAGWLVTLGVTDLGFGEGLSEQAAALVDEAVATVVALAGGAGEERG